jgi:inward rectifier potassium channel
MGFDPQKRENWRLLRQDGRFNIARIVQKGHSKSPDLYHRLMSVSWQRFLVFLCAFYLSMNLLFGALYWLVGAGAIGGVPPELTAHRFLTSFFFSVQTFATIGYGQIHPVGIVTNLLVVAEAYVGMLSAAVVTGLVFARFARPTARVIFSDKALIIPHEGVPSFIFRIANERLNQIVDATVTVVLSRDEVTAEGESYRNFYELPLERARSPIFALTWTVVHPIDERSPIRGMGPRELESIRAEFIISLTGIDDTFAQTIHTRYSYVPSEIRWEGHFADILRRENELIQIDLGRIHDLA